MRKLIGAILIGVLLIYGLWVGYQGVTRAKPEESISSRTHLQGTDSIGGPEIPAPVRTKVLHREPIGPQATHAPGRLKEFMLPEVVIDGLTWGHSHGVIAHGFT